jgi:hypothetical protein
LVEDEMTNNDFGIYYKTSEGDFINRVPAPVIKYGYNDSFIIAETQKAQYYIINLSKDFEFADPVNFLECPVLSKDDFMLKWENRVSIKFKEVNK